LLKTLYAEAMLSVQVHPDAAMAARLGLARGKDEAWLILEARPGARVGLGLRDAMSAEALRAAVEDGSIVEAMVWHEVRAGDALMVPAGTVHAIGAGMTLLEVQQNVDVTYRLHDHGRGRRLDVEPGLAVARREAWTAPPVAAAAGPGRETLVSGGGFVMERVSGAGRLAPEAGRPVWVAAVAGEAVVGDVRVPQGFVALVRDVVEVRGAAQLLLAQAGAVPQAGLWMPLGGG
jgi:mannose-6-phosphate isomerase